MGVVACAWTSVLLVVTGRVYLPVTGPDWTGVLLLVSGLDWTGLDCSSLCYNCSPGLFLLLAPATSFCPSLLFFAPALCVALLLSRSLLCFFASTPRFCFCFCFCSSLPLLVPYSLCYFLCYCLPETRPGLSCRTCLLLLLEKVLL